MSSELMEAPVADEPVGAYAPAPRQENAGSGPETVESVAAAQSDGQAKPAPKNLAVAQEELKQSLQLHAPAEKVVKLSKKALTLLSALGIAFLVGILFWGLSGKNSDPPKELIDTTHTKKPDGLNGLAADYAGVPQIGQPLPGDFGKPILANAARDPQVPLQPLPTAYPPYAADQPVQADPRVAQAAQDRESARTSQIFFGGGNAGGGQAATPLPTLAATEAGPLGDLCAGSSGRQFYVDFSHA